MTITYAAQTDDTDAPDWARSKSRLAGGLETLRAQLNAHYPNRDKTSDGFIGDDRHLAEGDDSDHNPWFRLGNYLPPDWLVRGGDFDVDGINAPWFAEQLRLAGQRGDTRLAEGGYVIFNGHITRPDFSGWTPYVGDPHTGHVHVSLARNGACDQRHPWAFLAAAAPVPQPALGAGPVRPVKAAPAPAPAPAPAEHHQDATGHGTAFRTQIGHQGPRVKALQAFYRESFPAYAGALAVDGIYGPRTAAVVREFCHRAAAEPTCPREDVDQLLKSDGANVGPRGARALVRHGWDD